MLTLWNPFDDLFRDDDFFFTRGPTRSLSVPVDVVEEKDAFVLRAEVPGFESDQVNVSVEGNVLTLKGERKYSNEERQAGYRRVERRQGSFQRAFALPDTVEFDKIDATLTNGVLTVRVPKKAAEGPRRIAVRTGGLLDKARKVLSKDESSQAA